LPSSTKPRYVVTVSASAPRKAAGSGSKPRRSASSEGDDVPGHEPDDVDPLCPAVPLHGRAMPDPRVQLLDRLLGSVLVEKAQADAVSDDHEDDHGVGSLAHEGGDQSGREEHEKEVVVQLADEDCERSRAVTGQDVRPHLAQAISRLHNRQAILARLQPLEDGFRAGALRQRSAREPADRGEESLGLREQR
jgi:hypothetical protein